MPMTRFPRTARVRARSDFDRIFKHGRRVALPVLALHWQSIQVESSETLTEPSSSASPRPALPGATTAPPGLPRLGLAVSRKVDPHAVGRNRIKRVLRDSFRHLRAQLRDGDYVVVARVGAARCSGDELRQAFIGLLVRAGALPASAAPVTMSPSAASPSPDPALAPRVD